MSAAWYPGSDVVDILGYDSYPQAGDHGPVSAQYTQLITLGEDRKLVTLPEVGSIPDPAVLKVRGHSLFFFYLCGVCRLEIEAFSDCVMFVPCMMRYSRCPRCV